MASLLFTLLPVALTFTIAAWNPNSRPAATTTTQRCTHC
jgi:hypothetical protein